MKVILARVQPGLDIADDEELPKKITSVLLVVPDDATPEDILEVLNLEGDAVQMDGKPYMPDYRSFEQIEYRVTTRLLSTSDDLDDTQVGAYFPDGRKGDY